MRENLPVTLVRIFALFAITVSLAACQKSLNSNVPSGMAGYQAVAVADEIANPTSYVLRPGDTISIDVFQEEELSVASLLVDEAGYINVPLVGSVLAEGMTTTELGRRIETAYGSRYLRDPNVTVALRQISPRMVAVEGEVNSPGVYQLTRDSTLLSSVAAAGSPKRTAKLDEVLIFREVNGSRVGGRFDLKQIRAGIMPDPQVLPGDVVVVGFSSVRGAYQDILQTIPILGIFTRF